MGGSGGGSSGGGGSTGTVDYPAYMKTFHGLLIDGAGADAPTQSVTDALNTALSGGSPFATVVAASPDTDITAMETAIASFSSLAAALSETTDYATMIAQAVATFDATIAPSSTILADRIAAYTTDLNAQANSTILPAFRAGMRDIGAVMSSAFTIGEAVITADVTRQIAKFSADIYYNNDMTRIGHIDKAMQTMASMLQNKMEYNRVLAALTVEQRRIKIVAKDEEEKRNTELDALDAKWDIELFQYASNVLAGIAGAVSAPQRDTGKSALSAGLGGALSGAAVAAGIGAMTAAPGAVGLAAVGGPWGLAAGAAIGIGMSFLK